MFKNLFKPKAVDFICPMAGTMLPLEAVNDPVFAEKALGDGFAIAFSEGNVYAPVDGEVVAIFPTNHAIGIKASDRNEFLLHIGLDTVKCEGKGFKVHVEQGSMVKKGDLLLEVDHAYFKSLNIDMTSPVIVTNLNGRKVRLYKEGTELQKGEEALFAITV